MQDPDIGAAKNEVEAITVLKETKEVLRGQIFQKGFGSQVVRTNNGPSKS